MKILWVSHFVPFPETGFGALQRSRNMLKECAEENQITLLALCRQNQTASPDYLQHAEADLNEFCEEVILVSQPETGFLPNFSAPLFRSMRTGLPYSVEMFRTLAFREKLQQLLTLRNFDLIHADTIGLCENILASSSAPIVLNHHNIESAMMLRRAMRTTYWPARKFLEREARLLEQFEKRWCSNYARNITVSKEDSRALEKIVPGLRAEVIENPVNLEYWTESESYETNSEILFVGGLDWYPNVDAVEWFCREIWPMILQKKPYSRVKFVGRNEHSGQLKSRYASSQLQFTGFVDEIRPLFNGARVFICPIRDGGGTNLKLVDAFASRVPVVSTSFGARGLDVSDGKDILLADSPEAFAKQTITLLDDSALANQIRASAFELVSSKYSSKIVANKLVMLYSDVSRQHQKMNKAC